jgi:hypothetical protein
MLTMGKSERPAGCLTPGRARKYNRHAHGVFCTWATSWGVSSAARTPSCVIIAPAYRLSRHGQSALVLRSTPAGRLGFRHGAEPPFTFRWVYPRCVVGAGRTPDMVYLLPIVGDVALDIAARGRSGNSAALRTRGHRRSGLSRRRRGTRRRWLLCCSRHRNRCRQSTHGCRLLCGERS